MAHAAGTPDRTPASLRERAARLRSYVRELLSDEAGPRLTALADELEAEATGIEAEQGHLRHGEGKQCWFRQFTRADMHNITGNN